MINEFKFKTKEGVANFITQIWDDNFSLKIEKSEVSKRYKVEVK